MHSFHNVRRILLNGHSNLPRRRFTVLAIETSCDDTSVAILQAPLGSTTRLLFHKTITSPNRPYGGIHPLVSLESHCTRLAPLVLESLLHLPSTTKKPDIIAVTRGPGMRSNLAVGLDTAKGLSVALGVPLVGVNHMQAHALTPRLLSAMEDGHYGVLKPEFPFLTLLVSGGHTMLLHSKGLCDHKILASSDDIAVGDMVDKCARVLLPAGLMGNQGASVAYGALLEEFCFPNGGADFSYNPPGSEGRGEEEKWKKEAYPHWKLSQPLVKNGLAKREMKFSFSGLGSSLERSLSVTGQAVCDEERRALGREVLMIAFEHLASRVLMALKTLDVKNIEELVVSGGVASNRFLRHLLKAYLNNEGYPGIRLVAPPPKYCTDNAAMIAWAGLEMYRAGYETDLSVLAMRKWSLDNDVVAEKEDGKEKEGEVKGKGGVLGASGWRSREIN